MRLLVLGASSTPICGVRQVAGRLEPALTGQVDAVRTCWWERPPDAELKDLTAKFAGFSNDVRAVATALRPDWVLLHYSVFTWGIGGVPMLLPKLTSLLDELGSPVAVVLHEYALAFSWRRPRNSAVSLTQRAALSRLLKRCPVAVVTTEQRLAALERRRGRRDSRLAFLPNPSPLKPVDVARDSGSGTPVRLGVLGWATPGYSAEIVAGATSELLQRGHQVQLTLVGWPGPETGAGSTWAATAARAGLVPTFTGVLDDDGLARAIAELDILVFPDPGGPAARKSTLTAALAQGIAVVAFDGPERWQPLVDARAVVLAPPDARALAAVIDDLLADEGRPLLETGNRARAFAEATLSPDHLACSMIALITESGLSRPTARTPHRMSLLLAINKNKRLKRQLRRLADRIPLPAGERVVRPLVGPLRGVRLPLDLSTEDRHLFFNTYEPWFQAQLARRLSPGQVVWDVGAFIGYYVAFVLRHSENAVVVAVEPNPLNVGRLRRTISLNGLEGVTVVDEAIGAEVGQARFEADGPIGALTPTGGAMVAVTTLDAMLERHPAPELLLMDIEGGEVAAIRGGRRLFSELRPTVLVELHGQAGVEAAELLESLGYRLHTQQDPKSVAEQMATTHRVHAVAVPVE